MRINFIYKKINSWGRTESLTDITSFAQIYKIDKNAIDEKTYSYIKALVLNRDVIDSIEKIRKESLIPNEGYTIIGKSNSPKLSISVIRAKVDSNLVKQLMKEYNIPYMLYSSLIDIIAMNLVHLPLPKIVIDRPYKAFEEVNPYSTKIVINSKVSKSALHSYIDENWKEISQSLLLQKKGEVKISDRDMYIIDLKDNQGFTFPNIVKKLDELYENETISLDAVKRAYYRARDIIDSLSKSDKI